MLRWCCAGSPVAGLAGEAALGRLGLLHSMQVTSARCLEGCPPSSSSSSVRPGAAPPPRVYFYFILIRFELSIAEAAGS